MKPRGKPTRSASKLIGATSVLPSLTVCDGNSPASSRNTVSVTDAPGGISMPVIDASPAAGMLYSTSVASSITKLRLVNSIFTVVIHDEGKTNDTKIEGRKELIERT